MDLAIIFVKQKGVVRRADGSLNLVGGRWLKMLTEFSVALWRKTDFLGRGKTKQ